MTSQFHHKRSVSSKMLVHKVQSDNDINIVFHMKLFREFHFSFVSESKIKCLDRIKRSKNILSCLIYGYVATRTVEFQLFVWHETHRPKIEFVWDFGPALIQNYLLIHECIVSTHQSNEWASAVSTISFLFVRCV